MYKIAIEREFDMAHIVETEGKCGRIHGHRWKLVVELEADNLREDGMIVDFTELKSVVDRHIVDRLDHRLLIPERFINDSDAENVYFSINKKKYAVPKEDVKTYNIENATSECIVEAIYHILRVYFKADIDDKFKISKIKLYETPTAYAEYIPSD